MGWDGRDNDIVVCSVLSGLVWSADVETWHGTSSLSRPRRECANEARDLTRETLL